MVYPFPTRHRRGHRVVVTGCGLISPLGIGMTAHKDPVRRGDRGFRPITSFDVSRQRVHTAGEIDPPSPAELSRLAPRRSRRLDRSGRLLLSAAAEACAQCGWPSNGLLPLILGTTAAGMTLGEAYYRVARTGATRAPQQPARAISYQAHRQAAEIADALSLQPRICIITNACASGANAIGHAADLIRSGRAERALAGGYDALCQLVFAGFDSLQALSPTTCRPFDARRDGLALGEGAAVLALESAESARARGVRVLGEIAGYGAATDIHHLTQPHPDGTAACVSMTQACAEAGVEPAQIDYINAHGTGTPLNDGAEAAAIRRWAGASTSAIPVSSTKAGMGHLLGAAGAVEAALCLLALEGQWLPPMPLTELPDPVCGLNLVTSPRNATLHHILSNSFGFGGANATLVFRRTE